MKIKSPSKNFKSFTTKKEPETTISAFNSNIKTMTSLILQEIVKKTNPLLKPFKKLKQKIS